MNNAHHSCSSGFNNVYARLLTDMQMRQPQAEQSKRVRLKRQARSKHVCQVIQESEAPTACYYSAKEDALRIKQSRLVGRTHGVMAPTMPTGCFSVTICLLGPLGCSTCPVTLHEALARPPGMQSALQFRHCRYETQ